MAKTVIKKLTIELNGSEVELTMAQARELKNALDELFGEKVREIRIPEPYAVRRPYVWPWREPLWKAVCGTEMRLSDSSVRLSVKS